MIDVVVMKKVVVDVDVRKASFQRPFPERDAVL
jgi:hypothetical protein